MDFMFVFFAALTVLCALAVAFHRSIVHSAFGLVGTLFGVAGLYWTLGADFLGGLQVLLYVGGVTVLILFAVMLTTRDTTQLSISRNVLIAAPIVGLVAVLVLKSYRAINAGIEALGYEPGPAEPTTAQIGNLFIAQDGFLLPFEVVAVLLLLVLIGAVTVARRGEGEGQNP